MARRSLLCWLALATVVIGSAGVFSSIWVLTHPTVDRPGPADAVVVLSGDPGGRLPRGLDLVRSGVAPVLVIAGLPDLPLAKALCVSSTQFEVVCLQPQPDTTRTEARAAGRLADERGWRRLIVVTDRLHVTRARLLFERCVKGSIAVVRANPVPELHSGWRPIVHEWVGVLEALTASRGC